MPTVPTGESAYGNISNAPGRRTKTQRFRSSSPGVGGAATGALGATATTVSANATVNECADAQAAVARANRAVTSRSIGLSRNVESGGQVTGLTIVAGGTGYSNTTNTAATGGQGTGLTINITQTDGVVTAVAVGNSAGRGYTVGDLLSENTVAGSGLSVRVTSVA